MAYLVIKKFYKDKAGRLALLVEGKLTDKNFWLDRKENRYSICLEESYINALFYVYNESVAPLNKGKLKERKNSTKDVRKNRRFYVV